MNNFGLFIGGLILEILVLFVLSKFYDCKIDLKNRFFYISLFLFIFFGMLNYLYNNEFLKIISSVILLGFSNWLIFRQSINKLVIGTLFTYFLTVISDIIGVLIVIFIFRMDMDSLKQDVFGSLIGNLLPSIIFLLISYIPFSKKIYYKLINITCNFKIKNLITLGSLIILSINFLLAFMYYEVKSVYVIIINSILLLIYSFIVYKTIAEKNNSNIIKEENISLLESLNQYEDMVDRQRVDNHENKNQLLIIKSMIKKNDKDVIKYIDTIVKDEKEDDEELYTKVKTIPSGGLQGIIYQKMLTMKDERIPFNLNVSRDVRKIELDDFSMEDNYRLCKVIGVLLDNAIEESRNIDNKCIIISLFADDNFLVVEISNKFNGIVDMDRIDDEGYTTKGDGHGYGLSLVKKILSETSRFINERCIKKNLFKQIIKIKIKNT